MKKITQCPVCGKKRFSLVETTNTDHFTFSVYQCMNCGLYFQNPMPDQNFLETFYKNVYNKEYHLQSTEHAFEQKDSKQEQKRIAEIEKFVRGGKLLDVGASSGFFLFGRKKYCQGRKVKS